MLARDKAWNEIQTDPIMKTSDFQPVPHSTSTPDIWAPFVFLWCSVFHPCHGHTTDNITIKQQPFYNQQKLPETDTASHQTHLHWSLVHPENDIRKIK